MPPTEPRTISAIPKSSYQNAGSATSPTKTTKGQYFGHSTSAHEIALERSKLSLRPPTVEFRLILSSLSLAYAEMRSILARMLWNFDMKLCEASKKWTDQRVFVLWEKLPLLVKLTERTVR